MTERVHVIVLEGLAPRPLSSYLAALGVFRLVAEGLDAAVRGCWEADRFVLRTTTSSEELERFLLTEYAPTPIVAPWNGGSGFGPSDNKSGIDAIRNSTSARFAPYRATIAAAIAARHRLGLSVEAGDSSDRSKVADATEKQALVTLCRATFPDQALMFLDAALALTSDGLRFPPLLGTGGNDGRLDFTNNFMQRVVELLDPVTGTPTSGAAQLLAAQLWGRAAPGLLKGAAIGQFAPGDAGGANQTTGLAPADSVINPWAYVLMMEGTCLFAGGVTRRMTRQSGPSASSFPFTVAAAAGVATLADPETAKARGELWLPLWSRPAGVDEVRGVFAEGRARVGGRPARDGVEFARAATTLGVDRGLSAFERVGIHERNGLAYFAVPLDRIEVGASQTVRLLDAIDSWLDRFSGIAAVGAPASLARARRRLEDAVLRVCRQVEQEQPQASDVQGLLMALANAEAAIVRSTSRDPSGRKGLRPLPTLDARWLPLARDNSPEWRLAVSLASRSVALDATGSRHKPLRYFLTPIAVVSGKSLSWRDDGDAATRDPQALLRASQASSAMQELLLRLVRAADQVAPGSWPLHTTRFARLSDIERLLSGGLDLQRLWDLTRALANVDLRRVDLYEPGDSDQRKTWREPQPAVDFATLRLAMWTPAESPALGLPVVQRAGAASGALLGSLDRRVLRLLLAGRSADAVEAARRRLRGMGLSSPRLLPMHSPERAMMLAIAMLFPLGPIALNTLRAQVVGEVTTAADARAAAEP